MSKTITLHISGPARTKGSFRAIQAHSRAFLKNSDEHLVEWTNLIKIAWTTWYFDNMPDGEWHEETLPPPGTGAFELDVYCAFARPKSHFGTGRNAGKRKSSAPRYCEVTRRPDCDKVLRAIMDALEGLIWKNDSQVVMATLRKCWSDKDFTAITISDLNLSE